MIRFVFAILILATAAHAQESSSAAGARAPRIGVIDVGLSWPGRYSHSPVEVTDLADVDALIRLIVKLAQDY